MRLSLGFSPCPNDTFIFDALIHKKIDTEGLRFTPVLADVEELNRRAFRAELDVTKLSYHAYAWLIDHYALLHSGSALGHHCGPLLIAKKNLERSEIKDCTIAIPGKYTTANFLLSLAYPQIRQKKEMIFSAIEEAISKGEVQAGVIIHENRFTYMTRGLKKIRDLGEYWESLTKLPIPLGGIVVKRSLSADIQCTINRVLKRSILYAQANPHASASYVRQHAQEMDEAVMQQHIQLYVNQYTVDLGQTGRSAIRLLFEKARANSLIPHSEKNLFAVC